MPYDNEYNKNVSNEIDAMNRKFLLNEKMTLDPKSMVNSEGKLSGGFLGALAGAVLPMLLGKLMGNGYSGGKCECDSHSESDKEEGEEGEEEKEGKGMSGGAMYNTMRDKLEGTGKASKKYKKQSEDKYNCGMGMAGGSAFGVGVGSVRDTGEGETYGQNLMPAKKRGRKSKMGSGVSGGMFSNLKQKMEATKRQKIEKYGDGPVPNPIEVLAKKAIASYAEANKPKEGGKKRGRKPKTMEGAGIISDMGIPLISNIAGMFGLGKSGGSRSDPLRPEKFFPKVLEQSAPTASKAVPPAGLFDQSLNIGSNMSGMGKSKKLKGRGPSGGMKNLKGMGPSGGAKKVNPWMELMAKVRKEHPELKGVKAVAEYIKKNNLYKK